MSIDQYYALLFIGTVLAALAALALIGRLRTLWLTRNGLNSTEDWIEAPPSRVHWPAAGMLLPYDLRLVTSHLEEGETLEGFTRAYFLPRHPKDHYFEDWLYTGGRGGALPLVIAVTSRRIMLFRLVMTTLRRYCLIPFDDIQHLQPPKPGLWGTSGPLRFGLKSGREYKLVFLGPLMNPEAMQYEQRLAAYLRELAPRFPESLAA